MNWKPLKIEANLDGTPVTLTLKVDTDRADGKIGIQLRGNQGAPIHTLVLENAVFKIEQAQTEPQTKRCKATSLVKRPLQGDEINARCDDWEGHSGPHHNKETGWHWE